VDLGLLLLLLSNAHAGRLPGPWRRQQAPEVLIAQRPVAVLHGGSLTQKKLNQK
jgi:hypothetical protein